MSQPDKGVELIAQAQGLGMPPAMLRFLELEVEGFDRTIVAGRVIPRRQTTSEYTRFVLQDFLPQDADLEGHHNLHIARQELPLGHTELYLKAGTLLRDFGNSEAHYETLTRIEQQVETGALELRLVPDRNMSRRGLDKAVLTVVGAEAFWESRNVMLGLEWDDAKEVIDAIGRVAMSPSESLAILQQQIQGYEN